MKSKILLSAYACEPGKGSEPGVGWNWALEIARLGHDVWVLTRSNNQEGIEAEAKILDELPNLHFVYYDLPRWMRRLKSGLGIYFYYLLWQHGAYGVAKLLHAREQFRLVHHITFGAFRLPSFMGRLGIMFLFGPVGGGESCPPRLRKSLAAHERFKELIRTVANFIARIDPLTRATFRRANIIYAKTHETEASFPSIYAEKVRVHIEIGVHDAVEKTARQLGNNIRILYVGRFLYWKGMSLGLQAFARARSKNPKMRLTMVGHGPAKSSWQMLADNLGISPYVDWKGWISHRELDEVYDSHDVFLFPSLHDSSGNVLLEAMVHGLPVVCLDLGGPGIIIDHECGRVVSTANADSETVIMGLQTAIEEIVADRKLYAQLSSGGIAKSNKYTWPARVAEVYKAVETEFSQRSF